MRAIYFYHYSLSVNCKTLTPEYRINRSSGTTILGILRIGEELKEKEKITVRCVTSIKNKGRLDTSIMSSLRRSGYRDGEVGKLVLFERENKRRQSYRGRKFQKEMQTVSE